MSEAKQKILLVEDDLGLQKQLKWSLDDYEIIVAADRDNAITQLRRHEPPVVLLDLGLPPDPDGATEGLATLQQILSLAPLTKIIVVTGNLDRSNAVKAISLGAYDFFQKPFEPDILKLMIERALHVQALEAENRKLSASQSHSALQGLLTCSEPMLKVCRTVEKVAPADSVTAHGPVALPGVPQRLQFHTPTAQTHDRRALNDRHGRFDPGGLIDGVENPLIEAPSAVGHHFHIHHAQLSKQPSRVPGVRCRVSRNTRDLHAERHPHSVLVQKIPGRADTAILHEARLTRHGCLLCHEEGVVVVNLDHRRLQSVHEGPQVVPQSMDADQIFLTMQNLDEFVDPAGFEAPAGPPDVAADTRPIPDPQPDCLARGCRHCRSRPTSRRSLRSAG